MRKYRIAIHHTNKPVETVAAATLGWAVEYALNSHAEYFEVYREAENGTLTCVMVFNDGGIE